MEKVRLTRSRIAGSMAGALMLLVGQSAMASELSYTYVELEYVDGEILDEGADGFGLNGSVAISDMFFLAGSYQDGEFDGFDLDIELSRFGVGAHGELNDSIDWVVSVDYARAEVGDSFDSVDDSGYILDLGIRGVAGDAFEYSAAIIRWDIGGSETGFRLGGRYHFGDSSNVSAGLDYVQYGSNWDQLELGIRYQFD
jgi:hypothetical protein